MTDINDTRTVTLYADYLQHIKFNYFVAGALSSIILLAVLMAVVV